ncbi:hypothetical protein NHX12_019673 [Muraenolepis orangiensis]|uniref:Uncharacterized protein n=1 Tax=Muraenolepis orangiensis TaxID=630683 RepID=A0A9Q0ETZ5_9TELE|nr:hypothetical protein NHX12_019673 [Muraenolepis orangiensis]
MSVNNGPAQTVAGQGLVRNENEASPIRKPKSPRPEHGVTIAVSLRVLFNIEQEQQIYEQQGLENYIKFQVEHETEPLNPGPAFSFVKSEQILKAHGLEKFHEHEKENENNPMNHGPLKGFLEALGKLQKKFYAKGQRMDCPIRTYLVTDRSTASSGTRPLKALRSWGLEIDEALFLAGAPKGPMLEKIRPHIFFGDQMFHVKGAAELGTVACHLPYGISQEWAPM